MAERVSEFIRLSGAQRSWARLLAWEGLEDTDAQPDAERGEQETRDYFAAMVEDARRRQEAGEFAADLDPAYVLLMLFAATLAPTVLRRSCGG